MSDARLVDICADNYDDPGCQPMLLFWYVNVGDHVEKGQDVCEVETAKAVVVMAAPASGTLVEILVGEGDAVESGQTLARIEV